MSLPLVVLLSAAFLALAYVTYGRRLSRLLDLDDSRPTPAHTLGDGVDFVPAKPSLLLAQHFSAIAAAGPIVGPILAGAAFGWGPALAWVLLGSVLIGGVHDFVSLVGSLRHDAASVVEVVRRYMGPGVYRLFALFVWLSLVYVITAFTDITSASFSEAVNGGGVATASVLYLFIAVAMGLILRKTALPLWAATLVFVPLVGLAIWFGKAAPLQLTAVGGVRPQVLWSYLLLIYCFAASVTPLWLLLQPRGYLGGFFLYDTLGAGFLGLLFGGERVVYPVFTGWSSGQGWPLFPLLFITVACGACSGFHAMVSSGTTSKQINKETDCRPVGYGGMLLEGLVAVLALATVMIAAPGDPVLSGSPDRIFAEGLSRFLSRLSVSPAWSRAFVLLAFATFIYDTLDVCTRLGRYMLQELMGWKGIKGGAAATLLTLALPAVFVSVTVRDSGGGVVPAWRLFWTVFGSSNQLLAAFTLLGMTVWLKRSGRRWLFTAIPMVFMMVMSLWSLVLLLKPWASEGLLRGGIIPFVAAVLAGLAVLLLIESMQALRAPAAK